MSADSLLSKLDKVKRTGNGSWIACCPAHADKSPSMTVREMDDGRVLVHCFAGCDFDSIVTAAGVDMAELFPPEEKTYKPVRRPFPAADVLEALSSEAMVVLISARDMARGIAPDAERLRVAVQRIEAGREIANG